MALNPVEWAGSIDAPHQREDFCSPTSDLTCSRPNARRIFNGIGFRTWNTWAPRPTPYHYATAATRCENRAGNLGDVPRAEKVRFDLGYPETDFVILKCGQRPMVTFELIASTQNNNASFFEPIQCCLATDFIILKCGQRPMVTFELIDNTQNNNASFFEPIQGCLATDFIILKCGQRPGVTPEPQCSKLPRNFNGRMFGLRGLEIHRHEFVVDFRWS
ncbi:hypothetical protein AVEN_177447-1 [Araneus ventricosus]|uniref:Uncharacterized protein n=1 Tax=Araneus ventricosus TaxID=182803 RepID=A0A4Y2LBM3_ARAVE|nr:hypothetical protein AVEN_177447-1 [Araneus ventricosus]